MKSFGTAVGNEIWQNKFIHLFIKASFLSFLQKYM